MFERKTFLQVLRGIIFISRNEQEGRKRPNEKKDQSAYGKLHVKLTSLYSARIFIFSLHYVASSIIWFYPKKCLQQFFRKIVEYSCLCWFLNDKKIYTISTTIETFEPAKICSKLREHWFKSLKHTDYEQFWELHHYFAWKTM